MMPCIKGKGYGSLCIFLFNPPKSEINLNVSFFFGIANEGHACSEDFIEYNTPCSTNLVTFLLLPSMSVKYERVWH